MSRKCTSFLIIILILLSTNAFSKQEAISDSLKRNSLVALPYAYYTPETKIAFGVGSIYSFRSPGSSLHDRPSNVKIALTYTQLKQTILSFIPEIYFNNESILFNGFYTFYKFPDKFWGIGNNSPDNAEENYTPHYLRTFTNLQKRILPGLYIGMRYQLEYIDIIKTDEDGVLGKGLITGSEGGLASGLGMLISYDTRDHVYYPTTGRYYQIYAVLFDQMLGSDYKFSHFTFDLRKYYPLKDSHVMAFQSYNIFIHGNPPFQMLGLLGGAYWMRGYYYGRYRDKNMITFQSEYRFPLFWRLGGVAFAGFGDVASEIDKFQSGALKLTIGAGLRFMFDTQEKINARLDFGFGNDGNFGFYAMVLEAF
ncbi:BamA/TamA family outer membrane protein [candidate division KSB1 bacterium]|nr:BamA/TamA family outer membrane protein [candidate division KSB1 bacterium]